MFQSINIGMRPINHQIQVFSGPTMAMQNHSSPPDRSKLNARIQELAQKFHLTSFKQVVLLTFQHLSAPSMIQQLAIG
ncbi:hypothetical protein Z945_3421 [Sulfitobacter noctilucae]|nr:hypothetical protein Z945_3421 [Sulfitobacter noctilucae]